MSKREDIEFLKEMKERLIKAQGDPTQFQYVMQMIEDWILELKENHGN